MLKVSNLICGLGSCGRAVSSCGRAISRTGFNLFALLRIKESPKKLEYWVEGACWHKARGAEGTGGL